MRRINETASRRVPGTVASLHVHGPRRASRRRRTCVSPGYMRWGRKGRQSRGLIARSETSARGRLCRAYSALGNMGGWPGPSARAGMFPGRWPFCLPALCWAYAFPRVCPAPAVPLPVSPRYVRGGEWVSGLGCWTWRNAELFALAAPLVERTDPWRGEPGSLGDPGHPDVSVVI